MPIRHIALIAVASLGLMVCAMARTESGSTAGTTPDPSVTLEKEPPAAPNNAPVVPAEIQRGGGGVGFSGPNQQRQLAMIQHLLDANDEDWRKVSPKIEKVLAAKRGMSTGAGMNWTARNNQPPVVAASTMQPDTAPGKALQAVRDAVADEKATDDALAKTLAAVRDAKRTARADYDAAQNDLFAAVTPRQQAILMTLGIVE